MAHFVRNSRRPTAPRAIPSNLEEIYWDSKTYRIPKRLNDATSTALAKHTFYHETVKQIKSVAAPWSSRTSILSTRFEIGNAKLTEAKLMLESFYVEDADIVLSQQFFRLLSPSSLAHDGRLVSTTGAGTGNRGWRTNAGAEFYTFSVKVLAGQIHPELEGLPSFHVHFGMQLPREAAGNTIEPWITTELLLDPEMFIQEYLRQGHTYPKLAIVHRPSGELFAACNEELLREKFENYFYQLVFSLLSKTLLRHGYLGTEYVQSTAMDLHNIRQNYMDRPTNKLIHSTVMEYYNRFLMAVERLPTTTQYPLDIATIFFQNLSPDTMEALSFETGMAPDPRPANESNVQARVRLEKVRDHASRIETRIRLSAQAAVNFGRVQGSSNVAGTRSGSAFATSTFFIGADQDTEPWLTIPDEHNDIPGISYGLPPLWRYTLSFLF